jgi:hypothetical protein
MKGETMLHPLIVAMKECAKNCARMSRVPNVASDMLIDQLRSASEVLTTAAEYVSVIEAKIGHLEKYYKRKEKRSERRY